MPDVTLERIIPATYVQAPVSALSPTLPDCVGVAGTLCVLVARYGSIESRTRQICAFLGEGTSILISPGIISQDHDLLVHTYHTKLDTSILREPLRDDLSGEYVNAWRLTGPEVRDEQARADFLETLRARWRVLRRAELSEGQ